MLCWKKCSTATSRDANIADGPGGITPTTGAQSEIRGMSDEMRIQALEVKVDQVLECQRRIEQILIGDPTDQDKVGLLVRIDRLERTSSGWVRFLWLATGVVLTAVVASLINGA